MSAPSGSALRVSGAVALVLCVCAGALQIAAFYPGYLTHDSAYQWWQGRHNDITTLWPPGMALFLGLFDTKSTNAPTAFFLLHSALYWCCAAYLSLQQPSWVSRISVAVIFCVFPTVTICLPHVWSDVALAVGLLAATLGLDFAMRGQWPNVARVGLIALCSIVLVFCVLLRHNALVSLPPLLWLAACRWRLVSERSQRLDAVTASVPRRLAQTTLIAGALLGLAIATYSLVPRWVSKTKADTWAITLIWDLQALSVASGKVLIPASISRDASIADLRASFDPVNAVTTYVTSKSAWANATLGLSNDQRRDLLAAWAEAIARAPADYLRHRIHVFGKLVGSKLDAAVDGSADDPIHLQFRDNPPLTFANADLLRAAQRWVSWLKPQTWASPLTWMIVATSCIAWVLLRRARTRALAGSQVAITSTAERLLGESRFFMAACIWLSGLLYLLALLVLTPTADMRYALWPVMACVAAACLAWRDSAASNKPLLR